MTKYRISVQSYDEDFIRPVGCVYTRGRKSVGLTGKEGQKGKERIEDVGIYPNFTEFILKLENITLLKREKVFFLQKHQHI